MQKPVQSVIIGVQPPGKEGGSRGSGLIASKTSSTLTSSKTKDQVTKEISRTTKSPPLVPQSPTLSLTLLSELHALRQKLELAESGLTQHIHIPLGENCVQECSQRIKILEVRCVAGPCPLLGGACPSSHSRFWEGPASQATPTVSY